MTSWLFHIMLLTNFFKILFNNRLNESQKHVTMKRIMINKGTIGLIFYKGKYKRTIVEGTHWLLPWQSVEIYNMEKQFKPIISLNVLKNYTDLIQYLDLIQVSDNQIVLVYADKSLTQVLPPGQYAYWKGLVNYQFVYADISKVDITEPIDLRSYKSELLLPYIRVSKVESFENAILYVDNKPREILSPGDYYYWKNAIALSTTKVDLRQKQLEMLGQEILTKDKATIRMNFYISYKVTDIEKAIVVNKDYEKQLYVLMQIALREYVGEYTIDEVLQKKNDISTYIQNSLKVRATELGIDVKDSGIKDIILPGDMRDIMNQVLIAEKKAQANIIMRREETSSMRSMMNTAKLMEDNKMLYKLKEMEYVEKIAEKINNISLSGGGLIVDQLKDLFAPSP